MTHEVSGSTDGVDDLQVIVVGSSAGGLDALTRMLGAVPATCTWCFVVAQHLSPSEPSMLSQLLGNVTTLRVVEAVDGAPLEPGVVLVAPPRFDVEISHRVVDVVAPLDERRPWPSIDRLLQSAADVLHVRSVGVVLSGTGDDGAAGVEAIESAGGIVVIQDPDTAQFDGMPRAAFATGAVDVQAPAAEIAGVLQSLLGSRRDVDGIDSLGFDGPVADESLVEEVIATVLSTTGMDFSGYKRSTVYRQIARRQRAVESATLHEYVERLHADPDESVALARILLVTVTAFFRDSSVWEALAVHLRTLVSELDGAQLRLWVAGCASGEEAYTLAMLAADAIGVTQEDMSERVKIFATDLDEHTLDVARRGLYSSAHVQAVPAALRARWMRRSGEDWEVVPALRESIVFARHNVAFDPPFPKIHLISLRNTLIYFQSHLQERVLQLCQFALVPDGLLLLGKSERVPRADALFAIVDHDSRLYRRRPSTQFVGLPAGRYVPTARVLTDPPSPASARRMQPTVMYRHLLRALVPPALVLDEAGRLVEVIGDVSPWCSIAEGPHTGNVVDMLREPYRFAVRAMLSQLRFSNPSSVVRELRIDDADVTITATRLAAEPLGSVVTFRMGVESTRPVVLTEHSSSEVVRMTEELESTQEALQTTVEDLSASNEELQAMNEELQASSEELQASSEEVQASNEELEATNEELTTLNQELQARGAELARANVDLENIQISLTNGLVLVDRDLKVTRFTPLAIRLFSLIPEDIGRPLTAIPTTIPVPDLADLLRGTVAVGETQMLELSGASRDLLLQTQPYTDADNVVLGAIVVVIDVSEVMEERRERERANANLRMVTESIRELVWQRDRDGRLVMLTNRVEQLFGLARESVLADPSLLLAAVHPDDRERVRSVSVSVERSWQIAYRIVRPDGEIRYIEESATRLGDTDHGLGDVTIGSAIDVTDSHRLQAAADEQAAILSAFMHTSVVGVLVLDSDGRIDRASESFAAMVGFRPDSLIGTPMSVLVDVDPTPIGPATEIAPAVGSGDPDLTMLRITHSDGSSRPVTVETIGVLGDVPGSKSIAVVHDISRLRDISTELVLHEQYDQQTGLLTRAYFRSRTEAAIAENTTDSAMLWIDLDGFKEVNDRLGHRSGDIVLSTVARRLKFVAGQDDIVGRLGGDEFAVLVTKPAGVDGIDSLAHRILAAVREPVVLGDTLAFVSASIGISVYPQDGPTADDLLHNADTAMYSAKQRGRDRHVFFTRDLNNIADERAALRHELAAAVRNRDFLLYYQPIFDADSGRIEMIEALIRWNRGGTIVSAGNFIDIATETGQLRALGRIVLDLLDADMLAMHSALGQAQPAVAVNMSATELQERDIIDRLLTWNPAGGFDKVCIEVTESVLLDPGGRALDNLRILRRLGATISIDDFGTGYSNLDLLDRLEPGIIKIDRSLVERAAESERGAKILDAAVRLAGALDTTVVVEGVSSESLLTLVRGLDAPLIQGFHLAEPMPLDQVIALVETSATSMADAPRADAGSESG